MAAPTPAVEPVVALADVGANTWARVAYSTTGWREQPVFVYAPAVKRFVMAAGLQATGGTPARHYDAEEFELATAKWVNAYPPAVAAGRPESGAVGEDYSKAREKIGWSGFEMFYKDGESLRVAAGGQWTENKAGYEFCIVPDGGQVYAYLHDRTLRYDPAARTYTDTKAPPRTSNGIWGAMGYDPVNKEILHAGGDGGSADVATWAYSIERNEWRKLAFESAALRELDARVRGVTWDTKGLLAAMVDRFAVSERRGAEEVDWAAHAVEVAKRIEALAAAVRAAAVPANQRAGAAAGAARYDAAAAALRAVGPKLATGLVVTTATLAEVRAARELCERAADGLSAEPGGRARSPIAYDPATKKIVMFGGDGLDRALSDTWVYDCATRQWEQRFPAVTPLPRAGHVLAALPKSPGKIVLAGGYSRGPLAQDVWVYDVAANEWRMLAHWPLGKADSDGRQFSAGAPRTDARRTQPGAVNEDDVLVCAESARPGLVTWAMKVDPTKTIPVPEGQSGEAGAYAWNAIAPEIWERVASPDAARMTKFYADMPANQWTAIPFAKYAPGATNRWGTSAYDVDRHQFLLWGGGHSTSHENDVAHFSVRGGCWTLGYHPDDPIETVYASQPTPLSFADRPHVPVHAYKTYCYDPETARMVYLDRAYDPGVREWEPRALGELPRDGVMRTQVRPTRHGAVAFSRHGLFRLQSRVLTWDKADWDGPRPEAIWCDGDGFVYDSKRDCLWFGMKDEIYRYDMNGGKAQRVPLTKPKALGEYTFWGEQVYLPDADLILTMNLHKRADGRWGNVGYDPATGKFLWVNLKFVEGAKEVSPGTKGEGGKPFSWSDALAYDPQLKLVLLNNSSAKKVWAMKFDRATANVTEMGD